jgi:hemerythrin-like domain-containing protein
MMTERLPIHARKEDDALFAVLEESLGDGGPSTMMREEHRAIHERALQFRAILHELEETEHPAIVDAGVRLRGMLRRGADAATMAEVGERVVELLDAHFEKEERMLFPMAREVLDARRMAEVVARVETIEREEAESPPR